jgi:isopentenyldiphosphate isomerase
MSEIELFEVVDINDTPTGQLVDKVTAHAGKIVHRCAAVFIFDKDGDLYVQPHVKSGGMLDHTVGGHVSNGETYEVAAYREMEEEVGLTGVKLEVVDTSYYSDERRFIHMFGIFECVAPVDWIFAPNDEVHELRKMKVEVIVDQMNDSPELFTGGFINTMKRYVELKKSNLKLNVTRE